LLAGMPDHAERAAPPLHTLPRGAWPLWLATRAQNLPASLLHVTRREGGVAEIAALARCFAPTLEVVELPAWDSLPYDRARPSRAVTGARIAGLARLAEAPERPRLVVTSAAGLLQRVPPSARLVERRVRLAVGDDAEADWLAATLAAYGYQFEERVDEPGAAALRGGVADIFPAGAARPVRLDLDGDRVAALNEFNPVDQRSTTTLHSVVLLPATEGFAVPGEQAGEVADRLLPDGPLETLFDLLPDAAVSVEPGAEERIADWLATIAEAWEARRLVGADTDAQTAPPDRLYLRAEEVSAALADSPTAAFGPDEGLAPIVALGERPARTASELAARAAARTEAGDAVIVCAADIDGLARLLRGRLHPAPGRTDSWEAALELPLGGIGLLRLPLTESFRLGNRSLLAAAEAIPRTHAARAAAPLAGEELRVGDMVVEHEHGLARLAGLTLVEEAASARECLALEFAADERLLIAAEDAGQVWRYGSADAAAAPDRLTGEAWRRRRAEVEAEIAEMAAGLAERKRARAAATAAAIVPPRAALDRFVRRVPFTLTEDQQAAIDATLADMARARPMERLVCGDVGFGKTEVALHAAAAAALAGFQVAVAAPTTLLARQHLETFRRRLGGLGLRIAPLLRAVRSAEARATLAGLRSGEVQIVVGTHALAAPGVGFANLGLVVIDEEQRFGDAHKRQLHALRHAGEHAGIHALTMTATPLPRSLQAALLGLFDLSLLTTPPVARQPVRSFVVDYDDAIVRAALLREARRGGQSFVVCPRIADLAPMAARLATLVPELTLTEVHGKLRGEALDAAMLAFAEGQTDVLLATGIIEAGLDIPNANTMLVWRPDRFGLAQLHQLRGRVGRARARATAYLLTDPAHPIAAPARKRLERIAALDSLGAGFAISAADLDQRGAGDILGERQAGHIRLIGSELYGHLLARAVAGMPVPDWTLALSVDVAAYVPAETVPEPDLRLELYRRLARLESAEAVGALAEEIEDRFGDLPAPGCALLDLTRLRLACRALHLDAVHAGPGGIALTPRVEADVPALTARLAERIPLHWSRDRLILEIVEPSAEARLTRLLDVLEAVP
jgi:transcription-repair coupling factor (superfamily II helicase)